MGFVEARIACSESRVLAVGAGGIGCELLKTLVLSGFQDITIIDLDTIEISNLNRQFLFRKRHVGQSKSQVAREAALKIAPQAKIRAFHDNVKSEKFNVDFFKSFSIVLNGLDNLDARRHVNRIALAAKVPLVESGTAGYKGQVTVHRGGETECFECQPKPIPKKYPVCTIRNTPDKPIHCIVWSKDLLFPRLFGGQTAEDASEGEENEGEENGSGGEARKDLEISSKGADETAVHYASVVLEEVYCKAIAHLAGLEDMWTEGRKPPTPLAEAAIAIGVKMAKEALEGAGAERMTATSAARLLGLSNSHAVWTVEETAAVFVASMDLIYAQFGSKVGVLGFDKDFDLSVDFVCAASNLRSFCYNIPMQSKFEVKGMAGNIIHAIATTNAIIAGLIVLEAQKVLLEKFSENMTTFVQHNPTRGRLIQRIKPNKPNKDCFVCSKARVTKEIDVETMTLGDFVDEVLCKELGMREPTVMVGSAIHLESGDDLEEDEKAHYVAMRAKTLATLPGAPIVHNTLVQVEDFSQGDLQVEILVDCESRKRKRQEEEEQGKEEEEEGDGADDDGVL